MPDNIQEGAYSAFTRPIHDQGADEPSAIQSPIFGGFGGTSMPNEVAIQAGGILASQYAYPTPPLALEQQPQILPPLDLHPNDSHQSQPYSPNIAYSPRNRDFTSQTTKYRLLPVNDGQAYVPPDRSLGGQVASGSDQTFQSTLALPPPPSTPATRDSSDTKSPTVKTKEQRKASSNVVIACHQCRSRKIRCDSTRPSCNNCIKRNNECVYDNVPKRRGPDKNPGARQRSCKKRPAESSAPPPPAKRKRVGDPTFEEVEKTDATPKIKIDTGSQPLPGSSQLPTSPLAAQQPHERELTKPEFSPHITHHGTSPYSPDGYPEHYNKHPDLTSQRQQTKLEFSNDTIPLSPIAPQTNWLHALTRSFPLKDIITELSFLFDETGHWLAFMNHHAFLQKLADPLAQKTVQPSLVYAGLAMATLMKSSEMENGRAGHTRAVWFRDKAQQALVESWHARWIDVGLAEAALIIAFYEFSASQDHHPDRIDAAIRFLDNILQTLRLTMIDAARPQVSAFNAKVVPVVPIEGRASGSQREHVCSCPKNNDPDVFSSWSYSPRWDPAWTSKEAYEEESRRLCWCALNLVLSFATQCIAFNREPPSDLFLLNPGNYAIYFPGEVSDRLLSLHNGAALSPKESVWALYCRTMLLWSYCNNTFVETDQQPQEQAEATTEAWSEMQVITDSLAAHICGNGVALLQLTREYLHDTRLILTRSLRKLQGFGAKVAISRTDQTVNRRDAEEWIYYQQQVVKRARQTAQHINGPHGYALTRRPFQVSWFTCQLAMCLFLWAQDHTLTSALQLAKDLLLPLDYMCSLYPTQTLKIQTGQLRDRLRDICNGAGLSPPRFHQLPSVVGMRNP